MLKTLSCGSTLWVLCIAGSFQMIVVSTIWAWMPSFLNRYHGLSVADAAKQAAVLVLLGAAGALFWGWVADRLGRRRLSYKLLLLCAITTVDALLFIFGFTAPLSVQAQYYVVLGGGFLLTCTVGVSVSAVMDVTHPGLRSTGAAVHAFAINLFGLAVGPFLGGVISDMWSLQVAMASIPSVGFLAAIFYWKASRTYEADAETTAQLAKDSKVYEAGRRSSGQSVNLPKVSTA